jgi:flagellar basal-body rod modification protein FlgD
MTISSTSFTPFSPFSSGVKPAQQDAAVAANGTVNRPTAGSGNATTVVKDDASSLYGLSTDDFMTLFLAQLQNQDPTKPMDDSQMLNQLSQMSQIQTMQNLQKSLSGSQLAQSSALIGKRVTGVDVDGVAVDGVVTTVTQSNDAGLVLKVGQQFIKPDDVINVTGA